MLKPNLSSWRERSWNTADYQELLTFLHAHADPKYQVFNEKIINGVRPTLGVRMSLLRPLSQQIARGQHYLNYLHLKKGDTHEEILLEGLVIAQAKLAYPDLAHWIAIYVPKIDSWALCDSFIDSSLLTGHESEFWPEVKKYLTSHNPWSKRFAYIIMMVYYLDSTHLDAVLAAILAEQSDHYYVLMAEAWLLATAWVDHSTAIKNFLTTHRRRLPPKLVRMTAQKLRDSRRISAADKQWTKSL
jgi:3-methyladenine DNA glycosylase AlkD